MRFNSGDSGPILRIRFRNSDGAAGRVAFGSAFNGDMLKSSFDLCGIDGLSKEQLQCQLYKFIAMLRHMTRAASGNRRDNPMVPVIYATRRNYMKRRQDGDAHLWQESKGKRMDEMVLLAHEIIN
jgi:hypothetical protein